MPTARADGAPRTSPFIDSDVSVIVLPRARPAKPAPAPAHEDSEDASDQSFLKGLFEDFGPDSDADEASDLSRFGYVGSGRGVSRKRVEGKWIYKMTGA